MRKLLLFLMAALPFSAAAQNLTSNFEALPLSKPDTFYVNYSDPGRDVGFTDSAGHMYFPSVFDTSFGGFWSGGFIYSNMTDSVTSGFTNMYSAKAGSGRNGSAKYLVYQPGYGQLLAVRADQGQMFTPVSCYLSNNTYAYNSMRDGDFVAKKFGGVSGNDSDWFKVTIHGYRGGVRKADSIDFFLADFRSANNAQDYIVKDWRLVGLSALGVVDSMTFMLSSSDTGAFGMNTPGYFCMDDFTISFPVDVKTTMPTLAAKVYPNPAGETLFVDLTDAGANAAIYDMAGRLIYAQKAADRRLIINTASWMSGTYLLKLEGAHRTASVHFMKQ